MTFGVHKARNSTRAASDRRIAERTKGAFLRLTGDIAWFFRRGEEIAMLPVVDWRGRTLYTLRCRADYGVGPHDYNVTEGLLWHLLDLGNFVCPWHAR